MINLNHINLQEQQEIQMQILLEKERKNSSQQVAANSYQQVAANA